MSMQKRLQLVQWKLEKAGVKHAPLQKCLEEEYIDGRYVTFLDPPGVYYLLGTDNSPEPPFTPIEPTELVQLLFLEVPEDAEKYAALIDYKIDYKLLLKNYTTRDEHKMMKVFGVWMQPNPERVLV